MGKTNSRKCWNWAPKTRLQKHGNFVTFLCVQRVLHWIIVCWTSVLNFMEIVQAVKKLNSISRERLNFRRRPIVCTTLYRNPMQACNFGGTFDQLFLRIFLSHFHRRCLSTSSIPWCKKSKNDQKLKSRGSCPLSQPGGGAHCAPPRYTSSNISGAPWATDLKLSDNLNELNWKIKIYLSTASAHPWLP